MNKILLDFETRSDLDLSTVGTEKYLKSRNSNIVCLSYKINDDPAKLWLPGHPQPFPITSENRYYAFNMQFDWRVWNVLGRNYGFEELPIELCIDIMAICGRFTFPQALDFVGRVLKLAVQKSRRGKALMKKICSPPFKYTKEELTEFYKYCVRDTTTLYELLKALPSDSLSEFEQKVWLMTVEINQNGLPIDVKLARRVLEVITHYATRRAKKLPELTDGEVKTVGQIAAIREWINSKGCNVTNLQSQTVEELLDGSLPAEVRTVLEIRKDLGGAAVKKYKRVIPQVFRGRVYNNLRYYGAAPGRWAGLGFQAHNLPRATVDDIEETIRLFYNGTILSGDPMYAAKALIRPLIQAPYGKVLGVADFKSIENFIIAWVAGEKSIQKLHWDGKDEYVQMASDLYKRSYDEIHDEYIDHIGIGGEQRFFGKIVVLGAGYNLGATGLKNQAEEYGVVLDKAEAQYAIRVYRKTHPMIKRMWYQLKNACVQAILKPGWVYKYRRVSFQVKKDRTGRPWLVMTLPSGSNLYYCEPQLREDKFGTVPTHMGINSYNRQWQRLKLIPGRITENVVQSLARDILCNAKFELKKEGYKILMSIHDEVILELDRTNAEGRNITSLDHVYEVMCRTPKWADGLKLGAEGKLLDRYTKI